jgi:hypothetical protein
MVKNGLNVKWLMWNELNNKFKAKKSIVNTKARDGSFELESIPMTKSILHENIQRCQNQL